MAWQSDHNARDTENLVNAKAESFAQLICLRSVQAEKILRRVMLRRFADAGGRLQRACQGHGQALPVLTNSLLNQSNISPCTCGSKQVCMIHGSAMALANPDNKPPPPGKDPKDPKNVKEDTPTRDPDDSPDYAPGYYDGKGGGHREVAPQEREGTQVQEEEPTAGLQTNPEETTNVEKKEDPLKPDIPDFDGVGKQERRRFQGDPSSDPSNPNQDVPIGEDSQAQLPDKGEKLGGMPDPEAPVQEPYTSSAPPEKQGASTDSTSPFGDPMEKPPGIGEQMLKEGKVRPGQPNRHEVNIPGQ